MNIKKTSDNIIIWNDLFRSREIFIKVIETEVTANAKDSSFQVESFYVIVNIYVVFFSIRKRLAIP